MSEPVGPAEPGAETGKVPGAVSPGGRRRTVGRWVRGRTARWVGVGAAVVVLGGVAAAAVHHAEEHRGSRVALRDGEPGEPGGPGGFKHRVVRGEDGERRVVIEQRTAGGRAESGPSAGKAIPQLAPAPLPELAAGDAVAKAAAAVPGGKVESLRPADRQGGGRSWQAVVVGTDGVRHLVTVDGTSGAVTGNTVVDGSAR
ncbi:hypothetical protein [Kitasatospora sp. DSM 101779]|uniref:hypothetical protein n=1 Tax=Kitasatospora sp. DSM 101779 TaxID=2853165 RepID=UPI0021DAEAC0|nr:hypothetical protein [Kitasatospora sp. DSM 101779]MCU7826593.1 hypothetical protein [Kitasatospora sp. DSM 101779]